MQATPTCPSLGMSASLQSSMNGSSRVPVLLANADYYGTLAATRELGAQHIPVYIASDRWLAVSNWSRHATRTLLSPPIHEPARFIDWLAALGEREPGVVLYPTSDETSFLYSLHADVLSKTFRMYQPALDAVLHVLDKRRLYETARQVGLDVPRTWFPETEGDIARIARDAPLPLLVKPRTQVLSRMHSKGVIVTDAAALSQRYWHFVERSQYDRALLERMPEAGRAMVQTYLPAASKQIYVVAAFMDRSGTAFAARAGMKIFQRPRSLGIGLCFEDAPLDPRVREGMRRLALATGYYGVFQLEFIKDGDRYLLIDFNPRLYNQLAFDVARGLPVPALVHAAATGDGERVRRLAAQVAPEYSGLPLVFCNEFGMDLMLWTQRLSGRMSAPEVRHWRDWRRAHDGSTVDPAVTPDDAVPKLIDVAAQLYGCARHPRAFLRQVVLDQTVV